MGYEALDLYQYGVHPYVAKELIKEKSIFNYYLSRAQRYVECTFGILSNKWTNGCGKINIYRNYKSVLCSTQLCTRKKL